jgi:3-deoxy-D-manno-octulosonate 8-phosphate phosphatase (KDO 8-P phosphatase)
MDCDGVLTDGRLYFSARGEEMKVFDVRDGQGIVSWHRAGFKSGIISGRGASDIIRRRAEELGISFVHTNVADKIEAFEEIISSLQIEASNVAYIGDDIGDIPIMKRVGFSIAVADAVEAVKDVADHLTDRKGGRGAVREVIDMLLAEQRK